MLKKFGIIITVVLAIAIVCTGCSGGQSTRPAPDAGAQTYVITGECSALVNGEVLSVSAVSDIEPGTNGTLSVYSAVGEQLELIKITQEEKNKPITAEFTIAEDWPDDVYAFLVFDTDQSDQQSKEIKEKYGKKFQNIVGDNTVWSSNGVAVVIQSDIVSVH